MMNLKEPVKLLVVEDREGFANLVRVMLEDLGISDIQMAKTFDEAWQLFQDQPPSICLVDIDLDGGEKNGILLVEKIRQTHPDLPVIYLTANYTEDYYEQCKHTRPSSFMNKELSRLKLYQAIELALLQSKQGSSIGAATSVIYPSPPAPVPYLANNQLFFKVGDLYKNIPIKEIGFFYANEKMTFARVDKRNFPTNVQLKTLEDELFPKFLRIHKSYLVNVDFIQSINTKEDKIELQGEHLPIGYSHRKSFLEQLKLLK
jgi:DNA-binding LytR/AlgR family response regulator